MTFLPWLKKKYGYTDDQIRPYTFNLQPFCDRQCPGLSNRAIFRRSLIPPDRWA